MSSGVFFLKMFILTKGLIFLTAHQLPFSDVSQRARKFKKVQAKKLVKSNESKNFFHEIAFLVVLNFFRVQELIFGHF